MSSVALQPLASAAASAPGPASAEAAEEDVAAEELAMHLGYAEHLEAEFWGVDGDSGGGDDDDDDEYFD